jgi:hypothetical protein
MKNLHLLPTDKDSNLFIGDLSGQLHFNYSIEKGSSRNQHIYITNSEEIKKGNWYLEEKSKFNPRKLISSEWGDGQHFKTFNQKGFRKIILTTDQDLIKDGVQAINDSFLEWFVSNPSCEYVEVELIDIYFLFNKELTKLEEIIKTYKIILPKEEAKQETLENGFMVWDELFGILAWKFQQTKSGDMFLDAEKVYEELKDKFKLIKNEKQRNP